MESSPIRSLRFKFTLALLITSLTAVLLVGFVARGMVLSKFNQNAMADSFKSHQSSLQAYISTYGSWEKAQSVQPFRDWMRDQQNSRRPELTATAPNFNSPPAPLDESPNTMAGQPPTPPGEMQPDQRPQRRPRPRNEAGAERRPGPPPAENSPASSFRFIVLDPAGKVLMGPPEMRGGDAPQDWQKDALPVVVNGQTAVLVVPTGEPNLSPSDRNNLNALNQGLLRGIGAAMLLAVSLGLFLGHRLGSDLRELTDAIEAMGEGNLRQKVKIKSRDEIGVLAGAFNRMSYDLSLAHEELQKSHAQITEQALMLQELSVRDELTKLYNRRFYDSQLAQIFEGARRYERPLTVMIGDIDHFKKINDTFSHATGDDVLRHIAAILRKATRQSDIVARYGGEEFVIAFPETPLSQAHALCERLRGHIEAYPWQRVQPGLRVTMSMGLCDDLRLDSAEKMVASADELLYFAKEHGRNRICVAETPFEAMSDGKLLEIPEKSSHLRVIKGRPA
jgi:diguanylate cyclase (GGDEF)-like protein